MQWSCYKAVWGSMLLFLCISIHLANALSGILCYSWIEFHLLYMFHNYSTWKVAQENTCLILHFLSTTENKSMMRGRLSHKACLRNGCRLCITAGPCLLALLFSQRACSVFNNFRIFVFEKGIGGTVPWTVIPCTGRQRYNKLRVSSAEEMG